MLLKKLLRNKTAENYWFSLFIVAVFSSFVESFLAAYAALFCAFDALPVGGVINAAHFVDVAPASRYCR